MLGSAIYRTAKQLKLLMRRNIIVYYLQAAGVSCAKSIAGWHCWERSCKHSTRNKKKLDASLSSFGYPPPHPPRWSPTSLYLAVSYTTHWTGVAWIRCCYHLSYTHLVSPTILLSLLNNLFDTSECTLTHVLIYDL